MLWEFVRADPGSTSVAGVTTIGDHLSAVGAAAIYRRPRLKLLLRDWSRGVDRAGIDLPPHLASAVINLAAIVSLTTSIGTTWRLLLAARRP
jgi:hypothetical protein